VIVLDTHAWVWLVDAPDRLGKAARQALRSSKPRGVAAVSCWEVAQLASRDRVRLDRDVVSWMEDGLKEEGIELVPLTPAVAGAAARLGRLQDPADRLVVATALVHGADLVTADARIADANLLRTIW
jgi:PIN domain nuclease of toxin-antitoxin system